MPVQLIAEAQDDWGEPLDVDVKWSATKGAQVSPEGVFTADKPGRYDVTAEAAGKSDTVPVVVAGDAWVEQFDDEYHDGWTELNFDPKHKPEWTCLRQKALGRMHQHNKSARTALLWQGGHIWADYEFQVDRVPGNRYFRTGYINGFLFRVVDGKNYYRFEKERFRPSRKEPNPKPVFRLVVVKDGKETELASESVEVPPTVLKGEEARKHPCFKYWKDKYLKRVKSFSFDRYRVEAKGDRITCFINGVKVIEAADKAHGRGTVGLYCGGCSIFDNVQVRRTD
jgi:hypothetical protein